MSDIILPFNWKPREYQMDLWKALEKGVYGTEGGVRRAAVVWHRRAGKDLFTINFMATRAVERVGLYWHLFPTYNQGRRIAWEGFTKEGRRFLDHFPKELVESQNDTEMRLKLKNGSIYQVVGTDSVDRLVGSNPIGVGFSEYSLCDPKAWHLVQPILAENGGWAVFIYTPRGLNHGYKLFNAAESNKNWFSQRLTVDDTRRTDGSPVVTIDAINEDRASGMPEELVQQEYYCSFEAPLVGAYYSKEMRAALEKNSDGIARIGEVPVIPSLPVHTAWDLGYDDSTTIWFWQHVGTEIRFVDYYENSGEGLAHYARILQNKGYLYGKHYAPHDIEVVELGPNKSRRESALEYGIRFTIVPRHDVLDGIDACRTVLPRCWFDKHRCHLGVECLKSYTKAFNEKMQIYSDNPLHNWASHGADAFRTFAWSLKDRRQGIPKAELDRYQIQEMEAPLMD